MSELYKDHRPGDFKGVVGQDEAISQLRAMAKAGKFPHSLLFEGPSGCGKTTIARILRKKLKCSEFDFMEYNGSEARGIDTIREINKGVGRTPMGGDSRVVLIDEVHKLTNDAQNALLKVLEDTPNHVYFFLATTDPQKLIKTILTRCHRVKCKPIPPDDLRDLVLAVAGKEGKELDERVVRKIVDISDGSGRQALVYLNGILHIEDPDKQLNAIEAGDVESKAFDLVQELMWKTDNWKKVGKMLKDLENEEPEKIRHLVLSYARSVMLGNSGPKAAKAAVVIEHFQYNFFDSKKAGLALACYNVCHME